MERIQTKTTEQFTTKNGKVVNYNEVFEGIRKNVEVYGKNGGRCMSEMDLEDIAQDSFLRAIRSHEGYDDTKSLPSTWGSRIADNCEKDTFTSVQRHGFTFSSLESEEDSDTGLPYRFGGYRGDEFEVDREMKSSEAMDLIEKAIMDLPENYREVIELASKGVEPATMAEVIGCSPEDVYRWLNRARKALKKILGREFLGEYGISE